MIRQIRLKAGCTATIGLALLLTVGISAIPVEAKIVKDRDITYPNAKENLDNIRMLL